MNDRRFGFFFVVVNRLEERERIKNQLFNFNDRWYQLNAANYLPTDEKIYLAAETACCKWNVTCCSEQFRNWKYRVKETEKEKVQTIGESTKIRMSNSYFCCGCGCCCCCCRQQQIKPVDKIYGVQKSRQSHPCGNLVLSVHTTFTDARCSYKRLDNAVKRAQLFYIAWRKNFFFSLHFSHFSLFDVTFGNDNNSSDDGYSDFLFPDREHRS